jgi:hypothetical protein
MLKQIEQFSQLSTMDRVDAQKGIIFGVSVISIGEARGHNMFVDRTTLEQFLKVAKTHKDAPQLPHRRRQGSRRPLPAQVRRAFHQAD